MIATSEFPATSQAREVKEEQERLRESASATQAVNSGVAAVAIPQGAIPQNVPIAQPQPAPPPPQDFWTDMAQRGDALMSIIGSAQVNTPEAESLRGRIGGMRG